MYDAIIIGSGIGSLTTAGLLAGAAGARVLVLEKHHTPGGLTHSFRRMGASWDVGLHYVGDMHPGSRPRQLFDYLTGGALTWNRMPTGYDRFVLPDHGLDVTIPSSIEEYQRLLISLFPREKRAIRRYCRDVTRAYSWMSLRYMAEMVPPQASPPFTSRCACGQDVPWNGQSTTWSAASTTRPCAPSSPRIGATTGSSPLAARSLPTR